MVDWKRLGAALLLSTLWAVPWVPVWAGDVGRSAVQDRSLTQWIEFWHAASSSRAYTGTFVVSAGADMSVSRIWHVCDASQQFERIESLSGVPRTTLRRNEDVTTFMPNERLVFKERREALRPFPEALRSPDSQLDQLYSPRVLGADRVAGFDAVVVEFGPRDGLRYGHRIWSEQKSGLVVKLQTRGPDGRVLEQVAFTELQLDVPLKPEVLIKQMEDTRGYQVVKTALRKTSAEAEGWRLKSEVPGFRSVSVHTRNDGEGRAAPVLQWVFSDGLASVSLFLETFDPQKHTKERAMSAGATHSLTRRIGAYWVTAVGEVPLDTLVLFVQSLERSR